MQPLVKNLFKTFIISTVIAIGVNCAYYGYMMLGNHYDKQSAVVAIAGGTLLLTVILSIMTLPVLFLLNANFWNTLVARVVLYFSGPVVFIVAAITLPLSSSDKKFDLLTGIIFLLTHGVFYYLLVRKRKKKAVK